VIVLGEYRLGIAQSRHYTSYKNWLRDWITAVTVLDIEEETTQHYAAIGLELKRKADPFQPTTSGLRHCVGNMDFRS